MVDTYSLLTPLLDQGCPEGQGGSVSPRVSAIAPLPGSCLHEREQEGQGRGREKQGLRENGTVGRVQRRGLSMWRHHPSFLTCSGHVGLRTQKASSGMPSGDQLVSFLTPQILDLETEPLRVTVNDPRTHSILLSV